MQRTLLVLMILVSTQLMATGMKYGIDEDTMERDEAVYFFIPGPLLGFYYFEYQKALSTTHSVNAAIEYANFKYEGKDLVRLWGIYRYKLNANEKEPLEGFFLTPAIQLARSLDGQATIINSLFYLSWQYALHSGVSVQSFAGVGYGISSTESEHYKMYTGFSPSIGVSLGYTF